MPGYEGERAAVLKARLQRSTNAAAQAALADAMNRRAVDQLARIHARGPGSTPLVKSAADLEAEDVAALDPLLDGPLYRPTWTSREVDAGEQAHAGSVLAALTLRALGERERRRPG